MNLTEAKKQVYLKVKELTSLTVVTDKASSTLLFPYIVISIDNNMLIKYPRTDATLNIDIWYYESNYINADAQADILVTSLDRLTFNEGKISTYLQTRNHIEDEDEQIKRVNLNFDINIYEEDYL